MAFKSETVRRGFNRGVSQVDPRSIEESKRLMSTPPASFPSRLGSLAEMAVRRQQVDIVAMAAVIGPQLVNRATVAPMPQIATA